MCPAVRLSNTSDLGSRLLNGDAEALAIVIEAIRCADLDIELAARALRVRYADLADWWRRCPALDAGIAELRKGQHDLDTDA